MKNSKHKSQIILTLFRINTVLARRVKKREFVYLFLVILTLFPPASFWIMLLFPDLIGFKSEYSEYQMQISFSAAILFIFGVDILVTLIRFQNNTFIEPFHLSIFPIGHLQKLKFNLMLAIVDYKSLLYLTITLLLVAFFLKELSLFKALISAMLMLAFLLTMTVWFHVAYHLFGNFFRRIRSNVLVIFYVGLILFNVVLITKRLDLFLELPFVSHIGNALYALKIGDPHAALANSLFLSLFLVSGIMVLVFLATRRHWNTQVSNYPE